MSVHKKLQQARIELQKIPMKKSGHNKFAGYYYFELADFLEPIQHIFNDVGLCGVVSFTDTMATLTITDVEDERSISITCPMSKAALKGCHDVQNLGAVITYIRRYLWTTALEIVESDGVEAVTGKPIDPKVEKQRIADLLAEKIALINACTDMIALASVFKQAWQDLGNVDKAALTAAKDAKKAELTPVGAENVA